MTKNAWKWMAMTVALALAVHAASVLALPNLIMLRTMADIAKRGGQNHILHSPRATAASRTVVRPSPDLLYSICIYDLDAAHGALRISAHDMPNTYWSVALFDARTNNFYSLNDQQAKSGVVDFLLTSNDGSAGAGELPVVRAPTSRGIVLFRTLVNNEAEFAAINLARRHANCEPQAT